MQKIQHPIETQSIDICSPFSIRLQCNKFTYKGETHKLRLLLIFYAFYCEILSLDFDISQTEPFHNLEDASNIDFHFFIK